MTAQDGALEYPGQVPWPRVCTGLEERQGNRTRTGGPWTLHQLRHSALTYAAEDGANTATLLAYSGHTSIDGAKMPAIGGGARTPAIGGSARTLAFGGGARTSDIEITIPDVLP